MANWYFEKDCSIADFRTSILDTKFAAAKTAMASEVVKDIPIYDCASLNEKIAEDNFRSLLMQEWAEVLERGAGVVVLAKCYTDMSAIDRASAVFNDIMAEQRRAGDGADHFAAAGGNERIWNSLEKLGKRDPSAFVDYFSNVMIALVCEAWLGPNYQMTSQTNLVPPGGKAQRGHRDYHLGFQTAEEASYYPVAAHKFSPHLTLQGAVAHCDMPVASGPTKFLPFSQSYGPGYIAMSLPEFSEHFEAHYVQLPLEKGDAVFFNPAVFHGAGDNDTEDVNRLANLLQISSAFGRAMETVNRRELSEAVYPTLLNAWQKREISEEQVVATVGACAEGYPFPTNLDLDPPVDGLAPKSQADIMLSALERGLKRESFVRDLHELEERQKS